MRIATRGIVALVKDTESADVAFVVQSVRDSVYTIVTPTKAHHAISIGMMGAHPQPALFNVVGSSHTCPELFLG